MTRYCFALDLVDDPEMIAEYEKIHEAIWPEIRKSIIEVGIERMDIYRVLNRLFMIMDVNDSYSAEEHAAADAASPIVKEWEAFMWKYQQAIPGAKPGEKWVLMKQIFAL